MDFKENGDKQSSVLTKREYIATELAKALMIAGMPDSVDIAVKRTDELLKKLEESK